MIKIDLNCDLGESFGAYTIGMDEEVIPHITSANVGCGFHGGDPVVMEKTVAMCKTNDTAVGAHPGFPDLMGFGRRNMAVGFDEVKAMTKYQIGALMAFCMSQNIRIQHVKAHGALYNMAAKDYSIARAIAEAVYDIDKEIILLGLSGSEMIKAGKEVGLRCASEVFADRAYNPDGTLVARNLPGAMIQNESESAERIIKMIKEHRVTAITGEEIEIIPQSICVHGDNPKALEFVKLIKRRLKESDISPANIETVLA